MTQIEALQEQVRAMRGDLQAAASLVHMLREGCIALAQAGIALEARVAALEARAPADQPRLILPQ